MGLGHNNNVSLPTPIPNLPKIMEISCGYEFTVCIDKEGGLWSFGANSHGQLGTGNSTSYCTPQKIKDIPPVRSVSCGTYHTLIIENNSNLWSCGYNGQGQLCLENTENKSKYQQTSFQQISKISAGGCHSFFQNNKGEIFGCGQNNSGELGLGHRTYPQTKVINYNNYNNLPLKIVQFCSGYSHSLFLDSKGSVFSVGANGNGQLGLGHNNNQNVLNQIPNIPPIQKISCIHYSSYLIDVGGNLWSFGYNTHGELGHGDTAHRNIPTKIECLKNITQTVQGYCGYHFLAKDSQNKIFVMGRNNEGQLGTGNNQSLSRPQEMDSQYFPIWGGNPQRITNGWKHMCSEETMNWNEEEMKKLEILQPKINQVKLDLQSNNNNKIKQEFPPKSFETWNDAQAFLNEKYQQINEKLNKRHQIENQITQNMNKIENELKDLERQIQQLQKRKKELEENHLPNLKKTQRDLGELFKEIENKKYILEEMCSDVSMFCKNENEMNEELSKLFKQKKFAEFDCSDVSKLLWKMDMVRYQSLFELNRINGSVIYALYDDNVWEQLGIEQRDCFYISYYFEMMQAPGYFKTFSDDYDPDCCVCSHNTPEKTIHLLKEYEIPIEDDFILENNYCSIFLTSKFLMKDILGNDLLSQKGIETMKKLKEWKNFHDCHVKQLNTQ